MSSIVFYSQISLVTCDRENLEPISVSFEAGLGVTLGNFKTESSSLDRVCAFGVVESWKLEAILWKLEAILATEKEVLMNLDSDGVIDRVAEKSKLLHTLLTVCMTV